MVSPLYSFLITSYECGGKGAEYLRENLTSIIQQTYRPIQVIVSDHSRNDAIEQMIAELPDRRGVEIVYARFTENYGNPCANWNNAMKFATGQLWQPLALDDRLADVTAVARVVEYTQKHPAAQWFACAHITEPGGKRFIPSWNPNILTRNTISGPSAIVMRPSLRDVKMDPQFIWFLDLDWYYRLWQQAGDPVIIPAVVWVNRQHEGQLTNTVCNKQRIADETAKLHRKYGARFPTTPKKGT